MKLSSTLLFLLMPSIAIAETKHPHFICGSGKGGLLSRATDSHPIATIVKTRDDQSRIYQLKWEDGSIQYFKEKTINTELRHSTFDSPEMAVAAYHFLESFGLESYVPYSELSPGITLLLDGKTITTRPGLIQESFSQLTTPIDDFTTKNPGVPPTARGIQSVLNSGDWPRLYADWKIFWQTTHQVDLSIANLFRQGNQLRIIDVGDLLNNSATRNEMGIRSFIENYHFNMPNIPSDRIEFRPDFRKADPEFISMVKSIGQESEESVAARFGKQLDDDLGFPRGKMRDIVKSVKNNAKKIVSRLNKDPFQY